MLDTEYFGYSDLIWLSFWLYNRKEVKWEHEELIDVYLEAAKINMEDNPIEFYKDNLISAPFEFKEMKRNFDLGIGFLN